ncbi:MAG: DUF4294 domain-containing protein [Saprospiraceae bacterium]|nr:DUF4294 domain-containing protein [Saprospiraceae bacterium]
MKTRLFVLLLSLCALASFGQTGPSAQSKAAKMRSQPDSTARSVPRTPLYARPDTTPRTGGWARLEIENGDSIFVMSLWPVRITDRRMFKDDDERRQYLLYKNAARKVYPYAMEAIALYEQYQDETQGMNKRQRRRYYRHESRELKEDMTEQMKSLSKTQGKVLIKMIEKEVGKPFYEIIRETRGGVTAAYWHNMGKLYGYNLKEGYHPGDDPLLDEVFLDYDFGDPSRWYQ